MFIAINLYIWFDRVTTTTTSGGRAGGEVALQQKRNECRCVARIDKDHHSLYPQCTFQVS